MDLSHHSESIDDATNEGLRRMADASGNPNRWWSHVVSKEVNRVTGILAFGGLKKSR